MLARVGGARGAGRRQAWAPAGAEWHGVGGRGRWKRPFDFPIPLCPGVLRIFLTTPRSYAAVAFFGGHYEKPLCCGTLATSYEPIRRLRSRSQERIKPISSAHEAQGKVWRSQSRYPLHRFDRNPVVEVNRWRLAPIVQEERAHFPYRGPCEHGRRHFWQSHLALFVRLKSAPRADALKQGPELTGAQGKD